MPAATVSTAGILPDCPETVLPTVSTHGRGRLGMPRHDVSVCNSLSGVSNKKPSRLDESANRIFSAID
jgi:hypothetical protein